MQAVQSSNFLPRKGTEIFFPGFPCTGNILSFQPLSPLPHKGTETAVCHRPVLCQFHCIALLPRKGTETLAPN
ncbi:hypothetical protein Pse7367_3107 [Thalassoporum mexicanum PCC 7367]|nr:hypothetical protein Pse7367_3107 [Pseudanabaena sp. PCC 7367]